MAFFHIWLYYAFTSVRQIQALSFNLDEDDEVEEENGEVYDKCKSDGASKCFPGASRSPENSSSSAAGISVTNVNGSNQSSGDDSHDNDAGLKDSRLNKESKVLITEIKVKKNPDVDTSFLPDREREEKERMIREELRQEWKDRQRALKEENIQITFSYWDGSGHRRVVDMKKGNSIYQFLQRCLDSLRKEFYELRVVSADQLMYIKEDLIIPHHYTFYDFIVTKVSKSHRRIF